LIPFISVSRKKELCNLYSLPNTVNVIKPSRVAE